MKTTRREWMLGGAAPALAACGGGGENQAPPLQLVRQAADRAVLELASGTAGIVALDERLVSILQNGPQRTLVITPADGGPIRPIDALEGWSLVDFALHPARRAALTTLKARARPPSRGRRGAPVRLIRPAHSARPAVPGPGHPPRA